VGIPLPLRDSGCKQYWTDVQYGKVFLAKILYEAARNLAKRSPAHTRPHNSYKFWWGKLSNIAYTHHPERGTYPRIAVTATPHHASLYFVCVIVVVFDRMDSMA
jgi:hypothetical protein